MSRMGSGSVARGLRVLFESGALGALDDGELLERFLEANADVSEAAFRVLVERHGPMVLNICRGRLELHDAHDAFQATFLVLARKAGSVRNRGSLASWLHGAALRVVAKSRTQTSRRLGRERRAAESRPKFEEPSEHIDDRERDAVLHQELARLPLKYRTPLVLCYLEGLTHELAAERLDWPVGTVRGRLARGRDQLRARLARRGFDASALLPAARAFEASTRLVPAALADATVRSAAYAATYAMSGSISVLTQGVVHTMIMSKLRIAAMLTTVAAVGATGVGLITLRAGNAIDAGAEPIRGPVTWPQAGAIMKKAISRPVSAAGGMAGMMKGRRDSGLDEVLRNSQDLDGYVSETERDIDATLEALGKERDGRAAAIQQSLATHLAAKKKMEALRNKLAQFLSTDGVVDEQLEQKNQEVQSLLGQIVSEIKLLEEEQQKVDPQIKPPARPPAAPKAAAPTSKATARTASETPLDHAIEASRSVDSEVSVMKANLKEKLLTSLLAAEEKKSRTWAQEAADLELIDKTSDHINLERMKVQRALDRYRQAEREIQSYIDVVSPMVQSSPELAVELSKLEASRAEICDHIQMLRQNGAVEPPQPKTTAQPPAPKAAAPTSKATAEPAVVSAETPFDQAVKASEAVDELVLAARLKLEREKLRETEISGQLSTVVTQAVERRAAAKKAVEKLRQAEADVRELIKDAGANVQMVPTRGEMLKSLEALLGSIRERIRVLEAAVPASVKVEGHREIQVTPK